MADDKVMCVENKPITELRVVDLKKELEKRGLSKSGSKKELLERLRSHLHLEQLREKSLQAGEKAPSIQVKDVGQNDIVKQYMQQREEMFKAQMEEKKTIEEEEKKKRESASEDESNTPKKISGSAITLGMKNPTKMAHPRRETGAHSQSSSGPHGNPPDETYEPGSSVPPKLTRQVLRDFAPDKQTDKNDEQKAATEETKTNSDDSQHTSKEFFMCKDDMLHVEVKESGAKAKTPPASSAPSCLTNYIPSSSHSSSSTTSDDSQPEKQGEISKSECGQGATESTTRRAQRMENEQKARQIEFTQEEAGGIVNVAGRGRKDPREKQDIKQDAKTMEKQRAEVDERKEVEHKKRKEVDTKEADHKGMGESEKKETDRKIENKEIKDGESKKERPERKVKKDDERKADIIEEIQMDRKVVDIHAAEKKTRKQTEEVLHKEGKLDTDSKRVQAGKKVQQTWREEPEMKTHQEDKVVGEEMGKKANWQRKESFERESFQHQRGNEADTDMSGDLDKSDRSLRMNEQVDYQEKVIAERKDEIKPETQSRIETGNGKELKKREFRKSAQNYEIDSELSSAESDGENDSPEQHQAAKVPSVKSYGKSHLGSEELEEYSKRSSPKSQVKMGGITQGIIPRRSRSKSTSSRSSQSSSHSSRSSYSSRHRSRSHSSSPSTSFRSRPPKQISSSNIVTKDESYFADDSYHTAQEDSYVHQKYCKRDEEVPKTPSVIAKLESKSEDPAIGGQSEADTAHQFSANKSNDPGPLRVRKRKWGSTRSNIQKSSISISTESLKGIIDIKPGSVAPEVILDLSVSPVDGSQLGADEEDAREKEPLKIRRTVVQDVKVKKEKKAEDKKDAEELFEDQRRVSMETDAKCADVGAEQTDTRVLKKEGEQSSDKGKLRITSGNAQEDTGPVRAPPACPADEPLAAQRAPSPCRHPVSAIIHVRHLVRPYTIGQLKELLVRSGPLTKDGFWIDKIKSHCFAVFENEENAKSAREALHGTRWPSSNPKCIRVDFANKREMEFYQSGETGPYVEQKAVCEHQKPPTAKREHTDCEKAPVSEKKSREEKSRERLRERENEKENEQEKKKKEYVREWDRHKIIQSASRSRSRDRAARQIKSSNRATREKAKNGDRDGRRQHKSQETTERKEKKAEDEPPAKLLDDLFRKTKAVPCIYWLPLTAEQIVERQKMKQAREAERERLREERHKQHDEEQRARQEKRRNESAQTMSRGRRSPDHKDKSRERSGQVSTSSSRRR